MPDKPAMSPTEYIEWSHGAYEDQERSLSRLGRPLFEGHRLPEDLIRMLKAKNKFCFHNQKTGNIFRFFDYKTGLFINLLLLWLVSGLNAGARSGE